MADTFPKRTHTCGDLRASDVGKTVTLTGWVHGRRDLGGLIFVDLRDRYGKTQVVFSQQYDAGTYELAKTLRLEFVLAVTGTVERRPEGGVNKDLATGEIDVKVTHLVILNKADTTPFVIEDEVDANEDLRLKYRYLDLRRPSLQKNLALRHRAYQVTRSYFDRNGFLEIETPVLMKSTPEGARDYLVPSRIHKGKFYALPQSPQTYKQILMVAGLDRYFQIVKCFRDEDLRADRQPEFTQIDVELSFVDEQDVFSITEGLMADLFKDLLGVAIPHPFPKLSYKEAMERYGSDKPDTRFTMQLHDCSDVLKKSEFRVFREALDSGGMVAGFCVTGGADITRSQLDSLTETAKSLGAGGLMFLRLKGGSIESPIAKFLTEPELRGIAQRCEAKPGDLCLMVAGDWTRTLTVLGALRLEMGKRRGLVSENSWEFVWVIDFPLLEYSAEEKRFVAVHHPFTSPKPEDVPLLERDPARVRARAYDLVLNGNEIAGGSIRNSTPEMQSRVFGLLGMDPDEAKEKFGFVLEAFRYGAPPHGGIAFGFDRIIMLMAGQKSIRDVIAFPKTANATSLVDDSPSSVDQKQLEELHLKIVR
jgi:aspartyl-tRNA synthetase